VTTPRLRALLAISMLASGIDPIPRPIRREPPRDPPKPATDAEFHAHLDACARCRNEPFNLCSTGADIAERVGTVSFGRPLAEALPPGVDTVRVAPLGGSGDGRPVEGVPVARVLLDDMEPQTYRVLRSGIADQLPGLPTMGEAERAHRELHVMRREPCRSTLSEAAQKDRKKRNKAARKARRGNR